MTTRSARLASWQIRLIAWSSGLLWLSGVVWLWLHYFAQRQGEFGPETNPVEPWALRLHGAAMIAALIVIGSLLVAHVWRGWGYRSQRAAGLALSLSAAVLIVTGYLLYYAGEDWGRPTVSVIHWVIGLAALPVFFWHWLGAKRLRRR